MVINYIYTPFFDKEGGGMQNAENEKNLREL